MRTASRRQDLCGLAFADVADWGDDRITVDAPTDVPAPGTPLSHHSTSTAPLVGIHNATTHDSTNRKQLLRRYCAVTTPLPTPIDVRRSVHAGDSDCNSDRRSDLTVPDGPAAACAAAAGCTASNAASS